MLTELTSIVQTWVAFSLVLGMQIGLVLLLRKPVRIWLGAVACYRLWLLPLLWVPFYLLGPTLLAGLAGMNIASEQNGSQYQNAMQQFIEFELLPFNVGATDNPELAATGHAASYGWAVLALLWLAGTLALIAWQGRRWLVFSRQVSQDALSLSPLEREQSGAAAHFDARVPVRSFREVSSAALFGVVKPVLLLPEAFCQRYDNNQRHIILAHEAVHLRRKDNGWSLCALLLLTLFWTNPLVFIAWRYFRLDQELSCDALALTTCNKEQQKRYARTLLDSLSSLAPHTTQPALSAWDNLRDIKERSLMVKQHLHTAKRPIATQFGLLSLAMLGASLTVACAELVSPVAQVAEPAQLGRGGPEGDAISSDEPIGRILSEAIAFLNNDQVAEARARLAALRVDRLSPFETSRYEQLMFSLDMKDENYPGARAHLQAAIDSGGLNAREESMMRYQTAQLYLQEEKFADAAAALEAWIAAEPMPSPGAYYLLAVSHYSLNQFDAALGAAEKAVALNEGKPPIDSHYQLLVALLIEKEQFDRAIPYMEALIAANTGEPPRETYYSQLAGLYIQVGKLALAHDLLTEMVDKFDKPQYRNMLDGVTAQLAAPQ